MKTSIPFPSSDRVLRKLRILVIEDEPSDNHDLHSLLIGWNCYFEIIEDDDSLSGKIVNRSFDIILCEQPDFPQGKEKRILDLRAQFGELPIIFLTENTRKDWDENATACIPHPVDPGTLASLFISRFTEGIESSDRSHPEWANPGLEPGYMSRYFQDDHEHCRQIFEIFLDKTIREFNSLGIYLLSGQLHAASRLIHKITPHFNLVGMEFFGAHLGRFKIEIDQGKDTRRLINRYEYLKYIFHKYIPVLEKEYAALDNTTSWTKQ